MALENAELKERVSSEYPLPIAFEYQQLMLLVQKNDRYGMYLQLAHLYEVVVRYLTCITLSILRTHVDKEQLAQTEYTPIDKFIREHLNEPTVPICIDILKMAGKFYKSTHVPFMNELVAFLNASTDGIEKTGCRLLEELSSFHMLSEHDSQGRYNRQSLSYARDYNANSIYMEQLFNELGFLAGYPLIRLVAKEGTGPEGADWKAHVLKGSQAILGERVYLKPLEITIVHISTGWDYEPEYLGAYDPRSGVFLSIYPYAIFDVCKQCLDEKRDPFHDLFLYRAAISNEAIYHGISDTEEQSPHNHLVSLNLVVAQMWPIHAAEPEESDLVRIQKLQKNLEVDALQTIGLLREKYNVDLYVHRKAIEQAIQEFVISEQPAFLVVGDSGTGKTNLILTIANNLIADDKFVILQNCATWDIAAVESGVSRHLNKSMGLPPDHGFLENMDSFMDEQDHIREIYILLDAVNESADPVKLLKSIETDLLIQIQDRKWLKLVLTCRSESWKRLKNTLQTERFFYKQEGSIVHQLTKFTEDELRAAYQNYRTTYHLASEYKSINSAVRELIQYPLMLRLVADSYNNQEIPPDLTLGQLFQKYDEFKLGPVDEAHLASEERQFIDHLLDEFISRKTDRLLWKSLQNSPHEKIRNWSDRWSFKSPYYFLVDKGILLEVTRPDNEVEVRFLYDQYLEFKLAQKVLPNSKTVKPDDFFRLVLETLDFPSMYGALKSFLTTRNQGESKLETDTLIRELADINDVRMRGLLSDFLVTLSTYNMQSRQQVDLLLNDLLHRQESAGMLAVLVAHLLSDVNILTSGLKTPFVNVRKQATIFAFSLWQTEPEAAKQVFEKLSQIVAERMHWSQLLLLPFYLIKILFLRITKGERHQIIVGLEPLLDLSILMIPLAYRRPEATRIAGTVLSNLFARIPRPAKSLVDIILAPYGGRTAMEILGGGGSHTEGGVGWIEVIDKAEAEMLDRWQEKGIRWYATREATDPVRAMNTDVQQYLGPDVGDLNTELGDLIFTLAQESDRFVYLSIVEVLMTRVENHYEDLYQFAKRLYCKGNTHSQYLALRYFTLCTFIALGQPYCQKEHIEFANHMILDFLTFPQKVVEYPGTHGMIRLNSIPHLSHFGFGVLYEMHARDHGELDFVKDFVAQPWPEEKSDLKFEVIIAGLSQAMLFATTLARPKIGLILETMSHWIKDYENLSPKKQSSLAGALASYRSAFPNEVDLYLIDAPSKLKARVHTQTQPISLPALGVIGMQAGLPWVHTYVPEFRQAFEKTLARFASGEASLDQIARSGGREIVNMHMLQAIADALANARPSIPENER